MGDQAKTREELLKELTTLRARLNKMVIAKRLAVKKRVRAKRKGAFPYRRERNPTRAQNQLLSYIAHELKTPLNSLLGFIQLLRNGTYGMLTPEQSQAIMRMNVDLLEFVHLVNNILDFSKIDSGKMPVQVVETNPRELLERVSMLFEPFLREKGLQLEQRIDPDCPAIVMTDPLKIKSALINLLSNAIKFTPRGTIQIGLCSLPGQRGIRLSVSDIGIGIAPQELPHLFEGNQREVVRESPFLYGSGTGLGLAIVKKMVSALGGTIRVESALGVGTTFTLDIPESSCP
ncbi:MAG: HAMP domain-containing sensor histidine kinase [Candidatus Manganitrophus sp.]|nr:MAG: HAMP domain-containing sensor histidine kinase [Candidatus Manganitrophus sp.]